MHKDPSTAEVIRELSYEEAVKALPEASEKLDAATQDLLADPALSGEWFSSAMDEKVGDDSRSHQETLAAAVTILQNRLSAEQYTAIEPKIQAIHRALERVESLNRIFEKQLHQDREWCIRNINWDAFIARYIEGKGKGPSLDLVKALADEVSPDDSKQLTSRLEAIRRGRDFIAESELLLEEPISKEEADRESNVGLAEALESWQDESEKSLLYISSGRRSKLINEILDARREMPQLALLSRSAGLEGDAKTSAPTVLLEAITRRAGQVIGRLDVADKKLLNDAHTEVKPHALFIGGVQRLKEVVGLDEPVAWVNEIIEIVPAWLRAGLGRIDFVDQVMEGDWERVANWLPGSVARSGGDTLGGTHDPEANTITVSLNGELVEKLTEESSTAEERKAQLQIHLRHVIIHELFHRLHSAALPLSWLRNWYEVTTKETIALTKYIEGKRSRVPNQPEKGTEEYRSYEDALRSALVEDLADSAAYCDRYPEFVALYAPGRFRMLNEILHLCDETQLEALRHIAESKVDYEEKTSMARAVLAGRLP